jgi:hypothetical protein
MEWVVTYRINRLDDACYGLAEFFRGSEQECLRIKRAFAGGSCDIVKTSPWEVVIGHAEDWEGFLKELSEED